MDSFKTLLTSYMLSFALLIAVFAQAFVTDPTTEFNKLLPGGQSGLANTHNMALNTTESQMNTSYTSSGSSSLYNSGSSGVTVLSFFDAAMNTVRIIGMLFMVALASLVSSAFIIGYAATQTGIMALMLYMMATLAGFANIMTAISVVNIFRRGG